MKILVTGSCGYVGTSLVPALLEKGHDIVSVDTEWFGNELPDNPKIKHHKSDIRELDRDILNGVDAVIHLANIANDPAVDLNPVLSWEVNVLASQQLANSAYKAGVKHFIYASSGSVYGIKEEERVTEELDLVPISVYNKTKMVAERVFLSYKESMKVHCVRPATVCGMSKRMRLDVAVNLLTFQALSKGSIRVLGGKQVRPNIHIDDMVDLYLHLIENSSRIPSGCYNAGFENISILDIAEKIKSKIDCTINIEPSNDPRSYRQDSTKILKTGFAPKKDVMKAIEEIIISYNNGTLKDKKEYYTVKTMKEMNNI